MLKIARTIVVLIGICSCCWTAYAEEPTTSPDDLHLSQDLRTLLQAEMREITGASQAIVMLLVSGDWESIQRVSEQIRASYVMERNISDSQKQELKDKLPERFKRLDMEFHARAHKLGLAAASEDSEMVAFHYYRLLESCAVCHAAYAKSRFPGFAPEPPPAHQH